MEHTKCTHLLEASKATFRHSGLIHWGNGAFKSSYPGNNESGFEEYASTSFDKGYGRYICWVLLSVGAENLAKAACVCNEIVRGKVSQLGYPRYDVTISPMQWTGIVLNQLGDSYNLPQAEKYNYRTLDKYWKSNKSHRAYFETLCIKHKIDGDKQKLLMAGYKYLTQAIRNRDAHTYIADQRRRDFPAVEPIFVPSFNVLIDTMKANSHPF